MIATPFDEKEGKPAVLSDLSAGSFELLFPAVSPALLGAAPGPRCAGFGLITTVFPRRQRPTFPATLSRHFQRVMRCCSRTSDPSFQAGTRFAWGDLGASRLPRFGV